MSNAIGMIETHGFVAALAEEAPADDAVRLSQQRAYARSLLQRLDDASLAAVLSDATEIAALLTFRPRSQP